MGGEIAIAGSGPAGLSAAMRLSGAGFSITVFDSRPVFGGLPAWCLPEFRVPLYPTQKKIEIMRGRGIKFINKEIKSVNELLGDYDFVLLAFGAGPDAKIGANGENLEGTLRAIEFLYADKIGKKHSVGRGENVAVIGGGNTAIDAARVAARQGSKATVIYRRTEAEMPAYREEIVAAKKENVKFEFLLNPTEFAGKRRLEKIKFSKMQLGSPDESGRRKPVPTGETIEREFDKAIVAIGQSQNLGWLEKEGIEIIDGYKIKVDECFRTSLQRVYAAGDCVTGARTIGEATRQGMGAADAIIKSAGGFIGVEKEGNTNSVKK